MSHIQTFGSFYAKTVHLICPLIGFTLFRALSRQRTGRNLWKPLGIALLLIFPASLIVWAPFYALGLRETGVEVARTVLIVLAMVWSVGGIRGERTADSV